MAAGRYSGYRDRGFRDRDSDIDVSRRSSNNYNSDGDRERIQRSDIKDSGTSRAEVFSLEDREAINGRSNRSSSRGASSNSSGSRAQDREPGELSSGSDGEAAVPKVKHPLKQEDVRNSISMFESPAKKRKFSPIIWDRDENTNKKKSGASLKPSKEPNEPHRDEIPKKQDGVSVKPNKQSNEPDRDENANKKQSGGSVKPEKEPNEPVALPPPPPLPQAFVPINSVEMATQPVDVALPHDDRETGQVDKMEYEDDHAPARLISSSRWAGGNDVEDDEVEVSEDEIIPKKRKRTHVDDTLVQKRAPSPELGEVIMKEGSEGPSSNKSSSSQSEQDDMDVDNGECNDDANDASDKDFDAENERPKTPEPPQRTINMLQGCRSVDEFERLNKIDEGTYGVVFRARDKKTGEIVALKKVKMEKEREGFPLTSLREINILLSFHHPSIVDVKEVVVGSSLDSIFMVMEYMEHDLKGLMESMKQPFSQSEVKCLMLQLLEGVKYLHDNWVLHRDLKTSNLLLNNRGELKICDFGLARQYGSPLKPYTHLVVTLWYRAPELLLGTKEYSTSIDMWSVGCIMAELLAKEPLFNGKKEIDQLDKIFKTLGTPNEKIWPGFSKLPGVKVNFVKQQFNRLREKFPATSFLGRPTLSEAGFDLLNRLLTYDPEKRITAEAALNHHWFREVPLPKSKEFMPTFPAQHAQDRRLRRIMKSPDPLEEQRRKELQQAELGSGGLFG